MKEAVMDMTHMLADRATSIPDNPFASADSRVARAMAQGADVIDLSKGNPDGEPPEFMIEAAVAASHDPTDFRYAPFDGKPAYLEAAAHW
ncbi:MAG: diaminopimelate aminotransferase, partial [Bifidobacterium crudilactis]|nr:diaminopimelate aminotransferase [Bifidobacterium crudilactis]